MSRSTLSNRASGLRPLCLVCAACVALSACGGGGTGDPPSSEPDTSFFWGKWTRLDAEETWYFSPSEVRGALAGTGTPAYEKDAVTVSFPNAAVSAGTSEFKVLRFEKRDERSLAFNYSAMDSSNRPVNFTLFLIRDGGRQSSFSGTAMKPAQLPSASLRGLGPSPRAIGFSGAGGIALTIQNLKNEEDKKEVRTSDASLTLGAFSAAGFIPGDPYLISGQTLVKPVLVIPRESGDYVGSISLVDPAVGYSLKAELRVEDAVPTNIAPVIVNKPDAPGFGVSSSEEFAYRGRPYRKAWVLLRNFGTARIGNKTFSIKLQPPPGIRLEAGDGSTHGALSYAFRVKADPTPSADDNELEARPALYLESYDTTAGENLDEDPYNDSRTAYLNFGFTCYESLTEEYKDYSMPLTMADQDGNSWNELLSLRVYRKYLELPAFLVDVTAVVTSPEKRSVTLRPRAGSLDGSAYGTTFLVELPARSEGYLVALTPNFTPHPSVQFASGRVVYGIGSEATISGTRANTIHQAPDAYEPDNNLAEGAVEWRPGETAIYSKIRAAEGDPRDMFRILPSP